MVDKNKFIQTAKEQLEKKKPAKNDSNACISVWEYAGNLLEKHELQQNGELQYALFRWLRKNNTLETGGLCEDGFFDYGATVIYPCNKESILYASTLVLELNVEKTENLLYMNDIAIIGNDSGSFNVRRSNIRSFYEAAMRAGYREDRTYDRIIYQGNFFDFRYITKSGRQAIETLRQTGSSSKPITGILFSTHGTPYAIDFHNTGNNLYIPKEQMIGLFESNGSTCTPGGKAAYVDELKLLVDEGIISPDVTITLHGCLNGATGGTVPSGAEKVTLWWKEENKESPENIAWYISKIIPQGSVIANRTQVDSGKGLNAPVMYR
ncbi:MAG: hypothetical protein J6R96_03040, partial [Spirochaetaceae bacterium]|nr:hypothetical protein [Spirochaetaceae bacterium]